MTTNMKYCTLDVTSQIHMHHLKETWWFGCGELNDQQPWNDTQAGRRGYGFVALVPLKSIPKMKFQPSFIPRTMRFIPLSLPCGDNISGTNLIVPGVNLSEVSDSEWGSGKAAFDTVNSGSISRQWNNFSNRNPRFYTQDFPHCHLPQRFVKSTLLKNLRTLFGGILWNI